MKKLIAYIVSWVLYYLGDLTSYFQEKRDWLWIYKLYQWCMIRSLKAQEWGNIHPENQGRLKGPWKEPETK